MTVTAYRIQNFMGFEDSGWLELRPITLLFGRNSSGKSAIIRSLLLLRQSLESEEGRDALLFVKDDGFDFGSYREIVRDHYTNSELSFWFKCRFDDKADHPAPQRAYDALVALTMARQAQERPTSRSVTVRLIIGRETSDQPHVTGFDIFDEEGDIVFRASKRRNSDPGQSMWVFVSDFFDLYDSQSVESVWPFTELFTKQGYMPWIRVMQNRLVQGEESEPNTNDFGESYQLIWLILRGVRYAIENLLQSINYLGPLRAAPQRFYYVAGQGAATPERGQQLVRDLLRAGPGSLQDVNKWLALSGNRVKLKLEALDEQMTLYELRIEESTGDEEPILSANIREVGFGLTQMLPIVTEAILAGPGTTLVVEQPELHLHPRAQAELADLFIAMTHRGMHCLIETHSEHLLLRLRRKIAESWSGRVSESDLTHLEADNLRAYFVDRVNGTSYLEAIKIDSQGKMSSPPGFRGFFADDLHELALLNQAILGMQNDGGK